MFETIINICNVFVSLMLLALMYCPAFRGWYFGDETPPVLLTPADPEHFQPVVCTRPPPPADRKSYVYLERLLRERQATLDVRDGFVIFRNRHGIAIIKADTLEQLQAALRQMGY